MAAYYYTMATFYTAMATFYNIEHSRKLCSQKVSSPVFRVTRTDPHIFSRCPHLTMISRNDQPASKKDKLATIRMNQPHSKKDKLATILDRHDATLDPDGPGHPRPVWLLCHDAHLYHARVPDPVQNTVPIPAMLHTRAKMDPVLDTVPDPATLHTLAKVPTMEDLHSFASAASLPRSTAASQRRRQRGRGRRRGRTSGPARSYNDHSIQPCAAVHYCVCVLVYSWTRLVY